MGRERRDKPREELHDGGARRIQLRPSSLWATLQSCIRAARNGQLPESDS
jgi:hypothetical protein